MLIDVHGCPGCGTMVEQHRTFRRADDPLSCPQCESQHVERMLSSFMFAVSGGACSCAA